MRHSSVRGRHAIYQMTDEGFFVRGHANLRVGDGEGHFARELLLRDGDHLQVGGVTLMLVLTDGGSPDADPLRRKRRRRHAHGEAKGDAPERRRQPDGKEDLFRADGAYDEYDSYDEYDDF